MAVTNPTIINMDQFDTNELLKLESRAPDTYNAKMMIRGNSLLSSVYVKSITPGATLKVNYFDTTTGTDGIGERFDLNSHALIDDTAAGKTFRLVIPRIHNKPQVEVIVAGGTVEFGVYITVIADFPITGSILDGQEAALAGDGGIPIVVFDPADGKFYLLRGTGGALAVDPDAVGLGHVFTGVGAISPGPETVVISETVPAGKTWRLRYGEIACRGFGKWRLLRDGVLIAGGVTSAAREHDRVSLPQGLVATAGQVIELRYTYTHGPASIDISAFLGVTII